MYIQVSIIISKSISKKKFIGPKKKIRANINQGFDIR
jgi:hypothetical protein